MVKKNTEKTVKHTIEVDEKEMDLIRTALRLVRNFGAVEDWDLAQDLLADIAEEF